MKKAFTQGKSLEGKTVKKTVIDVNDSQQSEDVPVVPKKKIVSKAAVPAAPVKADSRKKSVAESQVSEGLKKKAKKPVVVQEPDSQDQSQPVVQAPKVKGKPVAKPRQPVVNQSQEDSDDLPVQPKKVVEQVKVKKHEAPKPVKSKPKPVESDEQSDQAPVLKPQSKAVKPKIVAKESSSQSEPAVAAKPHPKAQTKVAKPAPVANKPVVKPESSDSDEEEEEVTQKKIVIPAKGKPQAPIAKQVKPVGKPAKPVQPESSDSQEEEEQEEQVATKKVKVTQNKVIEKPQPVAQPKAEGDGEYEVCVKGVSFRAEEDEIRQHFDGIEGITRFNVPKRPDGKHKGLVFITFNNKEAFDQALELNGSELGGRSITVEKSIGKKSAPDGKQGFKNDFKKDFQGGKQFNGNNGTPAKVDADATTVFIGNISFRSSKESLEEVFAKIPSFKEVRIIMDRELNKPKGYGYAEFFDANGVQAALGMNGTECDGRNLNINPAENKRKFDGPREGGSGGSGGFRPRGPPGDMAAKKGFAQKFEGQVQYL